MRNTDILRIELRIKELKCSSAWDLGVKEYALDLLSGFNGDSITKENFLNGANDWIEYSYGGCSLIYDRDIAERLCTPSELKKKKFGELNPNKTETWLDVQARALRKAYYLIMITYSRLY